MHLFCFGLGYVSQFIREELKLELKVSGTHTGKRNLDKNEYIFNNETIFDKKILEDVTHILISIPPTEKGDPVFLSFAEYFQTLPKLKWIGYFSSTSVYGNHNGEWVTESSELKKSELGYKRIIAEKQWLTSKLPVNILRLSSIYGPNRSVLERISNSLVNNIFKEGHYFSRIHLQDLAKMTQLVMQKPDLGEIYNIADDAPSPQHEVIDYACKLMNIPPIELINFKDASLSETMQQYYNSNKRVDNNKIKAKYNYNLFFPSYKEGLQNCLKYIKK